MKTRVFPAAIILCLAAGACSRLSYSPREGVEVGVASWYGPDFHGRPTSSREIYDMNDMTAAHPSLPFGTFVMVTNLENERTAVVRINDRGPFAKGRIIDLSYAAARVLGVVGPGTARVRLEVLKGYRTETGGARFFVQVGSFAAQENAYALKRRLESAGYSGVIVSTYATAARTYYRVRVRAGSRGEALKTAGRLADEGFAVIVLEE
jgi:rare lipoprotein A